MGPGGFFLLIQTLPTFWATRILILIFFWEVFCWIPNFQISRSQISKFPEIWGPFFWKKMPAATYPQVEGFQEIQNMTALKIKIRSAKNVGKVWISRKQILLAPFGPIWANFLRGPEKCNKHHFFAYFPWCAHVA